MKKTCFPPGGVALCAAVVFALTVSACASNGWRSVADTWIGKDMASLKTYWGEPDRSWFRSDGLQVVQYHLEQIDPTCNHYWIVNDEGVVDSYYYEGECRRITQ